MISKQIAATHVGYDKRLKIFAIRKGHYYNISSNDNVIQFNVIEVAFANFKLC